MAAVLNTDAPAVVARDIGVRFFTERRDVVALQSLDLEVKHGEFLTLQQRKDAQACRLARRAQHIHSLFRREPHHT